MVYYKESGSNLDNISFIGLHPGQTILLFKDYREISFLCKKWKQIEKILFTRRFESLKEGFPDVITYNKVFNSKPQILELFSLRKFDTV